mmetsp:Transcript_18162/g.27690  ORF Transcript_18162/g.27690 Transcript_18162/m.27690 type:complete len:378 (-) Transcript_18162:1635-2768(-)
MPFTIYHPPPILKQKWILLIGGIVVAISYLFRPLLIVLVAILSFLVPYACRVTDDASTRRQVWTEFLKRPDLPKEFRETEENMDIEEAYWANERGMSLFTTIMRPKNNAPIKAVICYCHGYSSTVSFWKRVEFQRHVKKGIAMVFIEYEGHGRSDGILGLIPNFHLLVKDCSQFFEYAITKHFPKKKCFLSGDSLGGTVAMATYMQKPSLWSGVAFICPMCQFSEKVMPPPILLWFLRVVCGPPGSKVNFFGLLPLTPASGIKFSYKVDYHRLLVGMAPNITGRNLRLASGREMLAGTAYASTMIKDFDAPFLIVHGKDDRVIDPDVSLSFYRNSPSKDKEIKLYDGMWHNLTVGETEENIDIVHGDIIKWILERAK